MRMHILFPCHSDERGFGSRVVWPTFSGEIWRRHRCTSLQFALHATTTTSPMAYQDATGEAEEEKA